MTFDEALEIAKINPELDSAVMANMPSGLNKLEQTLYVYTKMCSILNYDPQFWASNLDEGPRGPYHQDINNIEKVNANNPDVVCYSFSLIFGKFLDKLGVDYIFRGYDNSMQYGKHSDIIVSVLPEDADCEMQDNFVNIYFAGYTDMNSYKVNGVVTPYLVKRDTNGDAVDSHFDEYFMSVCDNIINIVKSEEDEKRAKEVERVYNESRVEKLERIYTENFGLSAKLNEKEKLDIMLKQMASVKMDKYSASFYRKKIFKNITRDMDTEKVYTFSILRERTKENKDLYNMISILNVCDDNEDIYIKYSHDDEIKYCDASEIQAGFDTGQYDYILDGNMMPPNCILPRIKSRSVDERFGGLLKRIKVTDKSIGEYMINAKTQANKYPPYPQLNVYKMLNNRMNEVSASSIKGVAK